MIIELNQCHIESETETLGVELTDPIFWTPRQQLTLGVGLERRKRQTFLLGERFAFPGSGAEPNGESRVSVLRVPLQWLDRGPMQVIAARSTLNLGLDILDATVHPGGMEPDAQFVSWLGQLQWVRKLNDVGHQLLVRAVGQWSNDPLPALEQFGLGGSYSVRGYRYNELVRDTGYTVSVEYRLPILRNVLGESALQLAIFADTGGGWFVDRPTPEPTTLSSVGLGLLWDPYPKVHAELYWGCGLRDLGHTSEDIQDHGITFLLSAGLL
jgi:hemolysin activation/secretion protein